MTDPALDVGAAQTPMSEHLARIAEMLATGERRLIVEHPDPAVGTSCFSPDVASEVGRRLLSALPGHAADEGVELADDAEVGEAIYRAMYQHQGGRWESNETQEVWAEIAERFRSYLPFPALPAGYPSPLYTRPAPAPQGEDAELIERLNYVAAVLEANKAKSFALIGTQPVRFCAPPPGPQDRQEATMSVENVARQLQAFRHDPENGMQGDCYRTAIACVLGVDRDSVPHSHDEMTGPENEKFIDAWLRPQGLRRIFIPVLGDDFREVGNAMFPRGGGLPVMITGRGPRDVNHVVVVHGVDDFWCPTLGSVSAEVALVGPALPDNYFWAEWIVRDPTSAGGDHER